MENNGSMITFFIKTATEGQGTANADSIAAENAVLTYASPFKGLDVASAGINREN